MNPKIKKIIIWSISLVGASVLVIVGCITFFLYTVGLFKSHPTDEELISQLSENKVRYKQLISMFREDHPLAVVAPTWQSPEGQLSPVRWNEYKEIFKELELDMGLRKWDEESIWFLNSTRGMVTGGDAKGLMYKPKYPHPLYESLNERPGDLASGVMGYRKINDSWYITFNWKD